MKKYIFKTTVIIFVMLNCSISYSYERGTHAFMTDEVFKKSILNPYEENGEDIKLSSEKLYKTLGLWHLYNESWRITPPTIFGEEYYYMNSQDSSDNVIRKWRRYEVDKMPYQFRNHLAIRGWLMRGAVREDDTTTEVIDGQPDDDPFNTGDTFADARPINHFFDPDNNIPLTSPLLGLLADPKKNPDWALGTVDAFTYPNQPEPSRRNTFTMFDAYESMYRALTGWSKRDPGLNLADKEEDRNRYWATAFRSIGDVVHMIEDMGQPQHTRNELHMGGQPGALFPEFVGHTSFYEKYIQGLVDKVPEITITGTDIGEVVTIQNKPPKEINYGDYPLPEFDNYSDYWSTSTSGKDIFPYGKGLADFTNRNFFTPGSELGNSIYDYPVNDPNQYGTKTEFVKHFDGVTEITYYQGTLEDYLYPEQSVGNVSLISESVFHDDFNDSDGEYRYELDKNVYDDMAEHTIPRAVSYSAGFIDYFFRGKLQILDAVETLINNQRKIKIVVKNTTDDYIYKVGEFEFYYTVVSEFTIKDLNAITTSAGNKIRIPVLSGGELTDTDVLPPGEVRTILLDGVPNVSIDTTTINNLTLVFTGFTEKVTADPIKQKEHVITGIVFERPLLAIQVKDENEQLSFSNIYRTSTLARAWETPQLETPPEIIAAMRNCEYVGERDIYCEGYKTTESTKMHYLYQSSDAGLNWTVSGDPSPTPGGNRRAQPFLNSEFAGDNTLFTLRVDPSDEQYNDDYAGGINNLVRPTYNKFVVYQSSDQEKSLGHGIWNQVSELDGIFHPDDLIYIGRNGDVIEKDKHGNKIRKKSLMLLTGYSNHTGDNSAGDPLYTDQLAVFRSDDEGRTWGEPIYIFPLIYKRDANGSVEDVYGADVQNSASTFSGQQFGMVYLGGKPGKERLLVYAGGHYEGDGTFFSNRMYLSNDGGRNWSFISKVPRLPLADDGSWRALPRVGSLRYLGADTLIMKVTQGVAGGDGNDYHESAEEHFTSFDAGRTWQRFEAPLPNVQGTAAFGDPYNKIHYDLYYMGDNGAIPDRYVKIDEKETAIQ